MFWPGLLRDGDLKNFLLGRHNNHVLILTKLFSRVNNGGLATTLWFSDSQWFLFLGFHFLCLMLLNTGVLTVDLD